MARFALNPPNERMVDERGYPTPSWYRFFARTHGALGEDAVSSILAAPIITHAATAVFSDDKVLTQGAGLSFTSGASTLAIALATTGVTAAAYGSASEVPSFTVDQFGRLTAAANVAITAAAIGAVPASRSLTAGAGLTGGGDLSADRTIDVGAGTGITVNANDVALDPGSTLNTDHAGVTLTAGAGLTGGGDISASRSFAVGAGTGVTVNADDVALADTAVTPGDYGSATSVPSFTVDQQGRLTAASGNTIPALASGTYTPTATAIANIDSVTPAECQYMRVGNTVTVSGLITVDPTASATSTSFRFTLPIASNFGSSSDCGGAAASPTVAGQSAAILGHVANDEAQMLFISGSAASSSMFFSMSYQVI